jgi:hypothetical protein
MGRSGPGRQDQAGVSLIRSRGGYLREFASTVFPGRILGKPIAGIATLEELLRAHLHVESEGHNDRISALMFSGTMPPQLPVLIALIQILLGCDRRRRIRAPFGAL